MQQQNLEQLENLIKDGEVLQVRLNDRLKTLEGQYKNYAEELKKLGINPETAMTDIQQKEKEYAEGIQKLTNMIPIDIINQYKNYNFSDASVMQPQVSETPF